MHQLIEIKPGDGWVRYKTETEIAPGTYWRIDTRKPNEQTKRRLGLIPASSDRVPFAWLAPGEPWVKRVMLGALDLAPRLPTPNVDWNLVGLHPSSLRDWQKMVIEMAWADVERRKKSVLAVVAYLGAGKTLAGLSLCQLGERPVVFAQGYLHQEWRAEAQKFGLLCPPIFTYESANKVGFQPDVVIIDEILKCKNPSSIRHKRLKALCEKAEIVMGMTATPTGGGGGPVDWRWLRVLWGGVVPEEENCWKHLWGLDTKLKDVGPRTVYVTEQWDSTAVAAFVKPYVVGVEAPPRQAGMTPDVRIIKIPIDRSDYELIRKGAATSKGHSKRLAQTLQCTDGFIINDEGLIAPMRETQKYDAIEEFVDALGEPCVIYSRWTEGVAELARRFSSYNPAVVSGAGEGDNGMEIERFKRGETRLLIANSAYSQGMNLQYVCRIICYASLSLSPTDLTQSQGRVDRPGQDKQPIFVHFQGENTLDERVYKLVTEHQEMTAEQIELMLQEELCSST
jgi:hypothetical protein